MSFIKFKQYMQLILCCMNNKVKRVSFYWLHLFLHKFMRNPLVFVHLLYCLHLLSSLNLKKIKQHLGFSLKGKQFSLKINWRNAISCENADFSWKLLKNLKSAEKCFIAKLLKCELNSNNSWKQQQSSWKKHKSLKLAQKKAVIDSKLAVN